MKIETFLQLSSRILKRCNAPFLARITTVAQNIELFFLEYWQNFVEKSEFRSILESGTDPGHPIFTDKNLPIESTTA